VLLPVVIGAVWVFVVYRCLATGSRWCSRRSTCGRATWSYRRSPPTCRPGSSAFITASSAYRPLAMRLVVEFWIPGLSVLGAGLVVATLARHHAVGST
jgi:hypothetical protein